MKAERRHELQTNTLAQMLTDLPLYLRFHFGKILLGVLIVALVVLLIRQRMASGRLRELEAINGFNEAKRLINQLPTFDLTQTDLSRRASERTRAASQALALLEAVLDQTSDSDDAPLRAEVWVARGDLNWTLANLPEIPGATTQPSLRMPQTSEQYLQDAQEAYQEVLRSYSDRPMAALTAMFGLAAIAENRGQWDVARAQYDAILKQKDLTLPMQVLATQRLQLLPQFAEGIFTGTVTSQPTTLPELIATPAADTSTTQPATEPATQP